MTIGGSTSSLAPGFRFHPTDEELVRYYLRRKVCGKSFRCFDAISDIDIYKVEPWDLPGKSRLKTRDLEWYFFSVLDKKYGNGSRTNRATERGYWKTTGKDRAVYHGSQVVGMKKTLVYHSGRAPHGQRTNWVMHEYKLVDTELEKAGIVQDAFVLCRVFQKSGSGPKNGEQYAAPFVEEEWEDDELVFVPKEESPDEVVVSEDAYLNGNDLEQILGTGIPSENVTIPLNMINVDNSSYVEESNDFVDDVQKLMAASENVVESEQTDGGNLSNMPVQCDMHGTPLRREYVGESSHMVNFTDVNYLLEEPFWDATYNPQFNEGAYLETSDLSTVDMLEEYLTYFDANDYSDYFALDSMDMSGSENLGSEQAPLTQKRDGVLTQELTVPSQPLSPDNDVASSSKQEPRKLGSDMQGPFVKQASRLLGNIPASPAFASEFPSKDAALRLLLPSPPSSSTHVTAGMIQIRNMTSVGDGADWSRGKHGKVNIILSFGLCQGDDSSVSLEPLMGISSDKAGSMICRGWLYFIFVWVLILSMSFKIGTFICARWMLCQQEG